MATSSESSSPPRRPSSSTSANTFGHCTPRRTSLASVSSPASADSEASLTSTQSFASAVSAQGILPVSASPIKATAADTQTEWHVPSATVTTAVGGRLSVGHAAATTGDAEHELSSLFVSSEREREKERQERRRSWGGRVVSSAVTATVFGAAVGLTAYRIWNEGWSAIGSPAKDEEEEDDSKEDSHDEQEQHPILDGEDAEDDHEPAATQPDISHHTTRSRRTSSHSRQPRSPLTPRRTRRQRPQRPNMSDLMSLSSQHSSATPAPYADESDDEWNARLESMSRRVQLLIDEGQRALASPAGSPSASLASKSRPAPESGSQPQRLPTPPPEFNPRRQSMPSPLDVSARRDSTVSSNYSQTEDMLPGSEAATPASLPNRKPSAEGLGLGRPAYKSRESIRSASASSSYSAGTSRGRYAQIIPPLPWRKESLGTSPRWVQRPLSPSVASAGRSTPPPASQPTTPMSPGRPRLDSGSRIPRPESRGHVRGKGSGSGSTLGASYGHESPVPRRRSSTNTNGDEFGGNLPLPGKMVKSVSVSSGLVASRAAMFGEGRSRIPVRSGFGSISSIDAVVE